RRGSGPGPGRWRSRRRWSTGPGRPGSAGARTWCGWCSRRHLRGGVEAVEPANPLAAERVAEPLREVDPGLDAALQAHQDRARHAVNRADELDGGGPAGVLVQQGQVEAELAADADHAVPAQDLDAGGTGGAHRVASLISRLRLRTRQALAAALVWWPWVDEQQRCWVSSDSRVNLISQLTRVMRPALSWTTSTYLASLATTGAGVVVVMGRPYHTVWAR